MLKQQYKLIGIDKEMARKLKIEIKETTHELKHLLHQQKSVRIKVKEM
jgi:hypothetical protein